MTSMRQNLDLSRLGIVRIACGTLLWAMGTMISRSPSPAWSQSAPAVPNVPWHSGQEQSIEKQSRLIVPRGLAITSTNSYSLAELIDLAQAHNPKTHLAWERARERADALGVARSELYPTLAVVALSQTSRQQSYLNTRFYRQTIQSFDAAFDLNYTVFDFGARTGRIDAAKAELLAADFAFNDVHRRLIYQVENSYFQLLNATGQVAAARANLANAQAVLQAAQASLSNGLATLPDVLEAKSAAARADYDLQATLGAEDIARGNLATTLGASPLQSIPVQAIEQIPIPDSMEISVEQAVDRALVQRPDLMDRVAAIRSANARVQEAQAAYFPVLRAHVYPDPQSVYGMQQTLPWGHTAALEGQISFSLDWTIFDGGARKHREAEAKDSARAAEAQAAATRDEIENGVWAAYSNLKTAFRQREAATALLQSADQSYNAALESYHYGVRNLLDVTDAQRTLAQARSADVLARTQVLTALAAFAFQAGDSVEPAPARTQP